MEKVVQKLDLSHFFEYTLVFSVTKRRVLIYVNMSIFSLKVTFETLYI